MNAIRDPSGDHAGFQSSAGLFVRFTAPEPSAFITKTSQAPFAERSLVNAILAPFGDHAGSESLAGLRVRLTWAVPSAFIA